MQWAEVLAKPWLQNIPFKIELNHWGRIEMSPVSNQQGAVKIDIASELRRKPGEGPACWVSAASRPATVCGNHRYRGARLKTALDEFALEARRIPAAQRFGM